MYYYEVLDYYGHSMTNPATPYGSVSEAAIAAKEFLITRNISDGYHINVFEVPPEERIALAFRDEPPLYPVYSEFITQGEVDAYALKRIEEANRQEFIDILANAQDESDNLGGQFSRGLLTPLEYAKGQENIWIRARFDIESKG